MVRDVRFKVGDRVELISPFGGVIPGTKGTIVRVDGSRVPYCVEFDTKDQSWVSHDDISLIKDNSPQPVTKASDLKVGAVVRIKSKEWYDANKDGRGWISVPFGFTATMAKLCGKTFKIREIEKRSNGDIEYYLETQPWTFSIEMFDLDSDKPKENIVTKTISKVKEAISPSQPIITHNIPLLRKNQLLTNLKLD